VAIEVASGADLRPGHVPAPLPCAALCGPTSMVTSLPPQGESSGGYDFPCPATTALEDPCRWVAILLAPLQARDGVEHGLDGLLRGSAIVAFVAEQPDCGLLVQLPPLAGGEGVGRCGRRQDQQPGE
jgi:hypothetical protein